MNVVVVRGRVAAALKWFEAREGAPIAGFDLVEVSDDGGRTIVPISWMSPPAWAADLAAGDELVVRGRVRKRFARVGTTSRPFTDVLADKVVVARRRAQVARLLDDAAAMVRDG